MDWLDGQERRKWLDRQNERLGNALRYYAGPAAEPINALAQGAAALSPGADMMDMVQSGGDLMRSEGGWDAGRNALSLGAATMGMAIPGTAKGVTEGVGSLADIGERMAKAVNADVKDIGSGAAAAAVRRGAITDLEAAAYAKSRGWLYGSPPASVAPKRPAFDASSEPIGNAPRAAWGAEDLQDYRKEAKPHETVENAYVSLGSIPKAKLAGGKSQYDWSELEKFNARRGSIPPVTVRVNKNGSTSIIDGNHRIEWFREQGYDSVPAYVIRPK
jgi:hypothetical protein